MSTPSTTAPSTTPPDTPAGGPRPKPYDAIPAFLELDTVRAGAEAAAASAQIAHLEHAYQRLADVCQSQITLRARAEREVLALQEAWESWDEEVAGWRHETSKLRAEIAQLQELLAEANSGLTTSRAAEARLGNTIASRHEEIDQLREEIAHLRQQLAKVNSEFTESQATVARLRDMVFSRDATIAQLRGDTAALAEGGPE